MTPFTCRCGNILFFDNTVCLQCGHSVGYDLTLNRFQVVEPQGDFQWCENGARHGVCNWVVRASGNGAQFCRSCQLTRTIPNLNVAGHQDAWRRMEAEKRRVVYTLARLGLMPTQEGVAVGGPVFDFLAPQPHQPVVTGHVDGVITINLLEADDVYREHERRSLREPYRTLVGHFRHEIGHYYWATFFQNRAEADPAMEEFRRLFGDERTDYATALTQHYDSGAPPNWAEQYLTAYASVHPWEDWAETWAHYLHIVDAVETSRAFGWKDEAVPIPFTPFSTDVLGGFTQDAEFLGTLNTWAKISPALNEIAASLGQRNLYPFALNATTARKLHFIHRTIAANSQRDRREKVAA
jgi:hypothetical protein